MNSMYLKNMNVRDNCYIIRQDYKKNRKRDANGITSAIYLMGMETKDIIKYFVDKIAKDYPNHNIVVNYDGIIKINITFDSKSIFSGDYYDIEKLLTKSIYEFEMVLNNNIKLLL